MNDYSQRPQLSLNRGDNSARPRPPRRDFNKPRSHSKPSASKNVLDGHSKKLRDFQRAGLAVRFGLVSGNILTAKIAGFDKYTVTLVVSDQAEHASYLGTSFEGYIEVTIFKSEIGYFSSMQQPVPVEQPVLVPQAGGPQEFESEEEEAENDNFGNR